MKSKIICCALLVLLARTVAMAAVDARLVSEEAKPWDGIVPLRSTRADVAKILGKPTDASDETDYFRLRDYLIAVDYKVGDCSGFAEQLGFGWNVPPGTVVEIGVIPTRDVSKDSLMKSGTFRRDEWEAGFVYFADRTNGFEIETYNGRVTLLRYMPEETQENMRCPKIEKCCIDIFPQFDRYDTLPFSEEKARLDNFVLHMAPGARGAIVVFGESPDARRKMVKRAERAKNYLMKVRGLEPQRLLIVNGGYNDHSSIELQLKSMTGENSTMFFFPMSDPTPN